NVTGSAAVAPAATLSTSLPAGFAFGTSDTGTPKFTFSANTITVTGALTATSPVLTTPSLGAATATSLLATGIVDGVAPTTLTTSGCVTGTHCALGGTYKSGYTWNNYGT